MNNDSNHYPGGVLQKRVSRVQIYMSIFIAGAFSLGTQGRPVGLPVILIGVAFFLLKFIGLLFEVLQGRKKLKSVETRAIIFALWYILGTILHPDFGSAYVTLQAILVVSIFIGIIRIIERKNIFEYGELIAKFILIISLIGVMMQSSGFTSLSMIGLSSIFTNPNLLGIMAMMCLLFFVWNNILDRESSTKLFFSPWVLLALFLVIVSNSRSVLLCFMITVITYSLWPIITKTRFFANIYFIIFLIGLTAIIIIFSLFTLNFNEVNNTAIKFTGSRINSGRQIIWPILIAKISQSPFVGYGPGTHLSQFYDTELSSHNLYLQIGLQTGLIGVFLLLRCLSHIWILFVKYRNSRVARFGASVLLGFMLQQSFEVGLTQNQLSYGLLMWLVLGGCVRLTLQSDKFRSV